MKAVIRMPISGIRQPAFITVDEGLRLRKYDGYFDFALPWYQDRETVFLVDGGETLYDRKRLGRMYSFLNARGELYFIEYQEDTQFRPVGDVAFWQEDLPILIGEKALRGRGLGRRVVLTLMNRARALGFATLGVREIYDCNTASRRLFEGVGFRPYESTKRGKRYRINL